MTMTVYKSLGKFSEALLLNRVDKLPTLHFVRYAKSSFKIYNFDFSTIRSKGSFLF